MLRRALLPALLVALALPAAAAALPGDPPPAAISPTEGATLKVDPAGIPAVVACPEYRDSDFGGAPFDIVGRADAYRVILSRSAQLDADGLLADVASTGYPVGRGDGTCDVRLGNLNASFEDRPQEEPGTYYWQVFRFCTGCSGGRPESAAPQRFALTADPGSVTLAFSAPGRAYSGYPFLVAPRITGAPDTAPIIIERRVRSSWRRVASRPALRSTAERIVTLKPGRYLLRAKLTTRISGTVVSPTRRVTVATRRSGIAGSDGRYRDPERSDFRATVAKGGRLLRGFSANVTAECPSTDPTTGWTDLNPRPLTATVPPIRIAPDGRFVTAGSFKGSSVHVSGRLDRGRLIATASISNGGCAGSIRRISARRG